MLWLVDAARVVVFAGGMLLAVLCLRVAWLRWQARSTSRTPPLGLVSYALLILVHLVGVTGFFGHPLTWRLPVLAAAFTLGIVELRRVVRVHLAPPWRRDDT